MPEIVHAFGDLAPFPTKWQVQNVGLLSTGRLRVILLCSAMEKVSK